MAWLSLSTFPSTPLNLCSQVPWLDFSFMNSLSATSQRGHIYNSLLCATPLPLINQIFTNASNCLSPALMFLGLKILNSSATQIVIPTFHTSHGGGGGRVSYRVTAMCHLAMGIYCEKFIGCSATVWHHRVCSNSNATTWNHCHINNPSLAHHAQYVCKSLLDSKPNFFQTL